MGVTEAIFVTCSVLTALSILADTMADWALHLGHLLGHLLVNLGYKRYRLLSWSIFISDKID